MSEVKRYALLVVNTDTEVRSSIELHPDGDYVKFTEYAALARAWSQAEWADRCKALSDDNEALRLTIRLNDKREQHCKAELQDYAATVSSLRQQLAALSAPAWSQEAPKVPGWYWWRYDVTAPRLSICELVIEPGVGLVERFDNRHLMMQQDGEWCPIVPPEGTR